MKHVSRSLCDSNLQGTNKRNDKESRWESFLVCSTNFSSFFLFSQFSEWLQQTDITSSSSTEHDARTVFIRLSEKHILFFQVTEGLNEFGVIASFRITSALMIIQNSTHNVILCLNLNLYLVGKKINESILFKHSYKFLFLVRFLQYWFMWPHV